MYKYACEGRVAFETTTNNDIQADLRVKYVDVIDKLLVSLLSRFDQDIRTLSKIAIGQAVLLAANGDTFSHTLEVLVF